MASWSGEENTALISRSPNLMLFEFRTSRHTSTRTRQMPLSAYMPQPTARPSEPVTQRPAAVVRPDTWFLVFMMMPPPRKPRPPTTPAATQRDEHVRAHAGALGADFPFVADDCAHEGGREHAERQIEQR